MLYSNDISYAKSSLLNGNKSNYPIKDSSKPLFLAVIFSRNSHIKVFGFWAAGLVVMGGDSNSEGHGFESRHRILDGHFFTFICCKNF